MDGLRKSRRNYQPAGFFTCGDCWGLKTIPGSPERPEPFGKCFSMVRRTQTINCLRKSRRNYQPSSFFYLVAIVGG